MKTLFTLIILVSLAMFAACGAKPSASSDNKTNSTKTETKTADTKPSVGAATSVVKDIYDNAMKRNCAAIPPMLTEDFRKAVGTTKDALDALCDTFTDSGKLASFEVKSEDLKADSGTVKVALIFKDGKKQEKDERVKKSGDKWLMDS